MKRTDLEKHLKKCGCELKREGGKHSIWQNTSNLAVSTVPRHKEIANTLCKAICKQLGIEQPKKF